MVAAGQTRERLIVGGVLVALTLLAWTYLISDARGMSPFSCCTLAQMSGSSMPGLTVLVPLFGMWSIMMVAMMLPTALPMVLTFATVSRNRRRAGRPYVPLAIFVAGYVIVWFAFSAI